MNGEQRDNPFGTGWGDPLPTGSAMPSGFPPFRRDFDNARDPYTARNALSVPEEALNNGNAYVRKNRAWVNGATLYIGEAPNDGKYYLRKSLGWSNIHGQPIPMLGVTDGSSATAGDIGELKSAAQTTPQTLTTGTTLSVASLSLGAGDWNIWGIIGYTGNVATTVNSIFADLSTTVNTLTNSIDHTASTIFGGATAFNFAANIWLPTPVFPVSFNSTTTYYVNALSAFGASTCSATGKIWARRMR